MQLKSLTCPACGAQISDISGRFVTCEYCDTRFVLGDLEAAAFSDEPAAEPVEEFDGSPIDVYASRICNEFVSGFGGDSFQSSPKILRGLGIDPSDEVFLIHDDTIFKSGKNGFAVTSRGLYCREMDEKSARFFSWEDFAGKRMPELKGTCICCGVASVCYLTGDKELRAELVTLYERLWNHAKALGL